MKDDNELKTFDELLEEHEELMRNEKYERYKAEYYGAFITNADNMIN